jgi:hypothetical protein
MISNGYVDSKKCSKITRGPFKTLLEKDVIDSIKTYPFTFIPDIYSIYNKRYLVVLVSYFNLEKK